MFLVIGLLGGGLICLLMINTVLATGSYQITALQKTNSRLAEQRQVLQERIAHEKSPGALYRRARRLGMVEPALTHYLNLRTGKVTSQPAHERGVPAVPGYTP